jgi:hypothetical protein
VKDERTRGEKDIQVIRDEGKKEKEKGNPWDLETYFAVNIYSYTYKIYGVSTETHFVYFLF